MGFARFGSTVGVDLLAASAKAKPNADYLFIPAALADASPKCDVLVLSLEAVSGWQHLMQQHGFEAITLPSHKMNSRREHWSGSHYNTFVSQLRYRPDEMAILCSHDTVCLPFYSGLQRESCARHNVSLQSVCQT